MSAAVVVSTRRTRTTAALRGPHEVIVDALITTAITYQWDRRNTCYILPLRALDRVLVAIETAGYTVDHREAGLW